MAGRGEGKRVGERGEGEDVVRVARQPQWPYGTVSMKPCMQTGEEGHGLKGNTRFHILFSIWERRQTMGQK